MDATVEGGAVMPLLRGEIAAHRAVERFVQFPIAMEATREQLWAAVQFRLADRRVRGRRTICARFPYGSSPRSAKWLSLWRTRQDSNLWPLPSEGNALSS
jgi:hypothetical protein